MAHPHEVFRVAVMGAACAMVLMHNHPSGGIDPSSADRALNKRVPIAGIDAGGRGWDRHVGSIGGRIPKLRVGEHRANPGSPVSCVGQCREVAILAKSDNLIL